jgi:hypothetical protein
VISPEQRREVERLFRAAGYAEPVAVAPVTSDDERVFVLTPGSGLIGRRDLEAALQAALGRKVWIVEESDSWPNRESLQ